MDDNANSRARFFPTTGGVLQTMAKDIPGYTYVAVDGVENCIAAIVVGIEPVVAAITGILFLGDEAPNVFTVIGILLVLSAILLPNIHVRGK